MKLPKNKSLDAFIEEIIKYEMFEAIGEALSIQDTSFRILYQNKVHKGLVGDHEGEYCYTAYEKRDKRCSGCPLAATFKDGEIHTTERTAPTEEGILYVEITTSPIRNYSGKIIAGIEIARTITDRKQAEKALKENEEKYRRLVDSLQEGIWVIDKNEKTTFINIHMANMLGYEIEEMMGKKVFDFMDERGMELCKQNIESRKQAINEQHDFELFRKDGKKIYVTMNASQITDDDGNYIGGVAGVIDITERKMAEEALLESERKLQNHAKELKESNVALKVLLKQRENDKKDYEENILSNIKHLIMPYLEKMRKSRSMSDNLVYVNILESNLKEIISPFSVRVSSKYLGFTPKEIQIANLIKDGVEDKEIAEILYISLNTVKTHRKNIRKKLTIYGKRTNLRTYLLSMSD